MLRYKYIVIYTNEDGAEDFKIVNTYPEVNATLACSLEEDGAYVFRIDFRRKKVQYKYIKK